MQSKEFFIKMKSRLSALPHYFWSAIGAGTVLVFVGILLLSSFLSGFRPYSTGEHTLANALPEQVAYLPYFKDGALYYHQDGQKLTAAANMYSGGGEEMLYDSNYALDTDTGRLVYIENGSDTTLKFFDGKATHTLGSHVLAWRTVKGMNAVAYVAEQASSDLGILFLYTDGKLLTLGTGIDSNSIRFSQDGQYLFALKPNTYPETQNRLFRYSMDGTYTILSEQCADIIWISEDGSSMATAASVDDTVYNYTLYADYCKKSLKVSKVYLPAVSGDQSILYMLSDYDATAEQGTLLAVDTRTLKTKELATGVNFFNMAAVTDSAKGIVYSVMVSEDDALFDIYYAPVQDKLFGKSKPIKLVKNAYESTLYTISLNTQKQQGYLLVHGSTIDRNALYEIAWDGDKLTSRTVDTGSVDGLSYFEKPDCITYVKNPSGNTAALYQLSFGGKSQLLAEDCAVTYDEYYGTFSSQSLLSDDGKRVLYFTDYDADDDTDDDSTASMGTLHLYDLTTKAKTVLHEQVSSAYGSMPTTDGAMSKIYYLHKKESTFDLYVFDGKKSTLLDTDVMGSLTMVTD